MSTDDTHTNHEHEPESMVVAFYRTCKHCGVVIEAESCVHCDGSGRVLAGRLGVMECAECEGTGVKRWVEEKQ